MAPDLAGKWICPMHPDVVKDAPGACDICGMPLVRAEDLGYAAAAPDESQKPLVVPVTAALVTGKRAVVYVEVPGTDRPTYDGREVALGPRAGDYYVVEEGLREGERVVTNGSFKIDSALQILAKPSMMAPEGGGGMVGHQHGESPAVPDESPPRAAVPHGVGDVAVPHGAMPHESQPRAAVPHVPHGGHSSHE
jgi:Cu(I)/Ag(I) efflux system membrane fusion protein